MKELVRDKESRLIEVYYLYKLRKTDEPQDTLFGYYLRDAHNSGIEGYIPIVLDSIQPSVFVKGTVVIEKRNKNHVRIDSKDLRARCPPNFNAYIVGEAVRFIIEPTITDLSGQGIVTAREERNKFNFRAVNFCRVKIPKGYE